MGLLWRAAGKDCGETKAKEPPTRKRQPLIRQRAKQIPTINPLLITLCQGIISHCRAGHCLNRGLTRINGFRGFLIPLNEKCGHLNKRFLSSCFRFYRSTPVVAMPHSKSTALPRAVGSADFVGMDFNPSMKSDLRIREL